MDTMDRSHLFRGCGNVHAETCPELSCGYITLTYLLTCGYVTIVVEPGRLSFLSSYTFPSPLMLSPAIFYSAMRTRPPVPLVAMSSILACT